MNHQNIEAFRDAEKRLWGHYGVEPVERYVRLQGLGIQVRVLEVGQGEPVLFLHGSPNAGSKWAPLAAKLADFRCLVLDRPGCGLSEPVDYRRTDLRSLASDLFCQTLDALGLPRVHLVASSLGGALGFYATHADPQRVIHLVQEGCPAFVKGFRLPFYNLAGTVASLVTGRSGNSRAAFRQMGHSQAMDQGRFESEVLTWRDALLKYTGTVRNENQLNLHLASKMSSYTYDQEFVGQIHVPTLYLWGEDDPFGSTEIGQNLAAAQPNARFQSFPASGHLPWLDDTASHAQLIRDFLRS
jgi:2-hydroxy-6-oxonona-2,4-dienedioate hydrolase